MKVLSFPELKLRGIPYTRAHVRRLVGAGEFPAPVQLSPHRIAWVESEVDAWLKARIAARDRRNTSPAE
jgi:prophage regulatory protein